MATHYGNKTKNVSGQKTKNTMNEKEHVLVKILM